MVASERPIVARPVAPAVSDVTEPVEASQRACPRGSRATPGPPRPAAILRQVSTFKIAPSILAADFTRLGAAIEEAEHGGADMIHVDVMDGHFVPNISMGPMVVAAAKRATTLPLDVHLMVEAPDRCIDAFVAAGADIVTVHVEVAPHLHRVLQRIRETGTRVGLAFNPLTPLTALEGALPYLDLVLVMTVNPGFGRQDLVPASLRRT